MKQEVLYGREGRQKLFDGVQKLATAVKSTLGPGGRNCVFTAANGSVNVTKDGVTVAKQIRPANEFENMGARILREASEKTAHIAGDGTTSSVVLAEAFALNGNKMVESGLNAVSLQRGIQSAAKTIINYIKDNYVESCTPERIKEICLVSTNWDEEIANLIATAVEKVGVDGSITVGDSPTNESSLKFVEGLQFARGFMSPYFVTDKNKNVCEFENPLIFLYGKKLINVADLYAILGVSLAEGKRNNQAPRPVLIIAPEIESSVITNMVVNKLKGVLNVCAIKCPGVGDRMKEQMFDLEAVVGGTYFNANLGRELKDITLSDFGSCQKLVVSRDNTTIIEGHGTEQAKQNRINYLQRRLEDDPESWDAKLIKDRISKISGKVAIIHIGASTESELLERQDRVDDAICAARAAIEEGIVPGGGSVLAKVSRQNIEFEQGDDAFNKGVKIVRDSLTTPLKQLLDNAGYGDKTGVVINEVAKAEKNVGINVKTGEMVNMLDAGIIDPFKVTRCSLENAASVAGLLLTTECLISVEEEKQA